ncbi:MAG: TetR/AcrR family transcriptional regulator [Dehalococcoidia bacterium]
MDAVLKDAPRRRRREETRERLLEAATAVFARSGFDRATVDEIVREAGFSKGAFYVHFESKEDLFWAMLEERIDRQQVAFRQTVDHSRPLSENVRSILSAVFGLVQNDPFWTSLVMEFGAHAARNEKVRERLALMYERWRELIRVMLTTGREAGLIRSDIDVEFTATMLIATVEGSIVQSRIAPESVRLSDMVEPLTRLLTRLLTPDG